LCLLHQGRLVTAFRYAVKQVVVPIPLHTSHSVLREVKIVRSRRFGDHRGYFSETYNRKQFSEAGIDVEFVQDNQSYSNAPGTIRGLHLQREPFAQGKLIRVGRGKIWDVAVDVRPHSPTFGQWAGAEISADTGDQIFIPAGFAHGFCTLEPDTEVHYKVSNFYSRDHEITIRWNDPVLKIKWPVGDDRAVLSDKDRAAPLFEDVFGKRPLAAR
jgi:dTDP-4-dehydrorhamnose 3,5-epimerase